MTIAPLPGCANDASIIITMAMSGNCAGTPGEFKIQNSQFKMSEVSPITDRTFDFAVRVVNLCQALDEKPGVARTLILQLIRSGTAIGANVEESQAAQSTADFINKLEIALKEARETRYWLRLLIAVELFPESRLRPLVNESEELLKILASIVVKTKRNRANSKL